ncbi:hypothetical protein P879_05169 [Paragonimus westermani]|uniref:Uncharacterized protein n=1 Tax=Paragonimus westermani TaxID=34504 RepID=A0A8T0DKW5_9TREM|nr:hypothetical protein P879_05169 [Paragonimus westermani]
MFILSRSLVHRRTREAHTQKCIKQLEDRIEEVSGFLRTSLTDLQVSSVTSHPSARADPGLTDLRANAHGQTSAIKDLYRRLDQLNEKSRRQYIDLQKEVRIEKDRLGQFNENLHKTVDSRSTELAINCIQLVLNPIISVLSISDRSKLPDLQIVATRARHRSQPQEIRKLAESLLAVKLALAMKITLLEKKEQEEHENLRAEISRLAETAKSFLPPKIDRELD